MSAGDYIKWLGGRLSRKGDCTRIGWVGFLVACAGTGVAWAQPTFVPGEDPRPAGKVWRPVAALSDEFEGDALDATKWQSEPVGNGWGWYGRAPGLFRASNVAVRDGKMHVTVSRLDKPVVRDGKTFTHQGAIVRSVHPGRVGWYFECRMKANATVMSSTFWLITKKGSEKKLELDIQECVGLTTELTEPWAKNWDRIFHSNLIDWSKPEKVQLQKSVPTETKNCERYYIYGAWWKSPEEVRFYLDGKYTYSIRPKIAWDVPSFIQMAVETYDWNPVPADGGLVETGTPEQRTTRYDWVRVWELVDGPGAPVEAPAAEKGSLHFKPAGHVLGDVHPFFHEGECFLYYLKPEEFDHGVGLARSRDLLGWREAPIAHARGRIERPAGPDDWTAPWFVLGVFRDPVGEIFRSFYGVGRGRMVSSVSRDLLHWDCAPKDFHVPPGDYYKQRRDPYVFWIPEMKRYGCVMTTWMKGSASRLTGGALSLATSPDLKKWTDHGAVIYPGDMGPPECPQMFTLGGRWYALASIWGPENGVGRPTYWTSDAPMGPWAKKPTGVLDGRHNCAAQVAFDGEVPLLFGWIPLRPGEQGKPNSWGGHLAIPREIYALPDGSLGSRLPLRLRKRLEELPWREVPGFSITAEARPLGGAGTDERRGLAAQFTLRVPTTTQAVRVGIEPLGEVVIERGRIRIVGTAGEAGSEIEAEISADGAVPVCVFVEADMVEVFVNDRYSLVARLPAREGMCRLAVRGEGSGASVGDARVSTLAWAKP